MSFVRTTYSKPKTFSWSFSKLKNYRTCPKRHYHYDVAKTIKEPESQELMWGNSLHKAFAEHVEKGTPLPDTMTAYQPLLDRLKAFPGETFVEVQYAITKDFGPTHWKDWNNGWYRGIGDIVKVAGEVAYAADYKTGSVKPEEYGEQLGLLAACMFAHYPKVEAIKTEFLWLKEDAVTTAVFKRGDMASFWAGILPEVKALQRAHEEDNFPARPSGLCKRYCAVTSCPHHGGKS